jgi:4-hydroxy-2-oxoheptanedioate aldolase
MRTNEIKQKLANSEVCRGVWLGLPSPFSAQLLAQLPLDWLMIDAEHSPVDEQTLALMVAAIAGAGGPAPFVRVAQASVENMKRTLDTGACGLVAPMINTREEAEQVVAWSKFPPEGQRSFGSAYAGLSFGVSMGEYLRIANRQTVIGIQVESKAALGNLDALFSVQGIDMAFVGPIDLAISLGLEPIPENPQALFQEALDEIIAMGRKHKLPLGIYCSNGAAARQRIAQGFQFVNVTSDIGSLSRGVMTELENSR